MIDQKEIQSERNRKRLRFIMAKHGVNCQFIAFLTHKSLISIRKYRSGERRISSEIIEVLEEYFNEKEKSE